MSTVLQYSDRPFPEIENVTTKAANAIYFMGFLINDKVNKNNFTVDPEFLKKAIGAGRYEGIDVLNVPDPFNFYGHPHYWGGALNKELDRIYDETQDNFYIREQRVKSLFLGWQKNFSLGKTLKTLPTSTENQYKVFGIIDNPEVVKGVQAGKVKLPKYFSPYIWDDSTPVNKDENNIQHVTNHTPFHIAFVDDPAYNFNVAKVAGFCTGKSEQECFADLKGLGGGTVNKEMAAQGYPCACTTLAQFKNTIDSSQYIQNSDPSIKMTDQNSDPNNLQGTSAEPNNPNSPDKILNKFATSGTNAPQQIAGAPANPEPDSKSDSDKTTDQKVGVDLETILQGERVKIEKSIRKEYADSLKAIEAERDTLKKEVEKRDDADRDRILGQYLSPELFKDKEVLEKRVEYYRDLSKKYNLPNTELENLLKDHYEIKQIDVTADLGGKKGLNAKGKQAGTLPATDDNTTQDNDNEIDTNALRGAMSF